MSKLTTIAPGQAKKDLNSIDALRRAVGGRVDMQVTLGALHKAMVETLKREPVFEDPAYDRETVETTVCDLAREASLIYSTALNWPERNSKGENPALSAVLDEIKYQGERYPVLVWEIWL